MLSEPGGKGEIGEGKFSSYFNHFLQPVVGDSPLRSEEETRAEEGG